MTRAEIPSSASALAASRHECSVTPAPTRVTWSSREERSTFDPPTGNCSPLGYKTGYAPRVVRIYTTPVRSAMACTSAAVLVASLGYKTVEP
jgi:hypothetical protein